MPNGRQNLYCNVKEGIWVGDFLKLSQVIYILKMYSIKFQKGSVTGLIKTLCGLNAAINIYQIYKSLYNTSTVHLYHIKSSHYCFLD